ncbi:MAG: hypothetical protein HZA20_00375 [Nitrospirae bacterium]|nr:hypothetical protein [Nitrospirota bacterium]
MRGFNRFSRFALLLALSAAVLAGCGGDREESKKITQQHMSSQLENGEMPQMEQMPRSAGPEPVSGAESGASNSAINSND